MTAAAPTVDTRAYPHAGTVNDPLQDADIQTEVTNFINHYNLTPGLNTEFFVFIGANVVECQPQGINCTPTLCAYHGDFQLNGNPTVYAVMPNLNSFSGCNNFITTAPNQFAADLEILAASHEFAESITDPRDFDGPLGWVDPLSDAEIADICVPYMSPTGLGTLAPDGSNVTLNGHHYVVQELWSNSDAACVLTFEAWTGATAEFTMLTGNGTLPQDAQVQITTETGLPAVSVLYGGLLHPAGQPLWDNGSTNVRILPWFTKSLLESGRTALFSVVISMSSPNGSDQWPLESLDFELRNANGTLFCEQFAYGNPLGLITPPTQGFELGTFGFGTPNCNGG